VHAWISRATRSSLHPSNTFTMEWPPRSGKSCEFPEWTRLLSSQLNKLKIRLTGQQAFLEEVETSAESG